MSMLRAFATTAVVLVLSAAPLEGQDLSRYRDFSLGASLDAVVAASGARVKDARTLHARPANIQELEWRSQYGRPPGSIADPVRQVLFTFYEDQLYQIVVTYDSDRTEGLTDGDLVAALSVPYGSPVPGAAKAPRKPAVSAGDTVDTAAVARWESSEASVTLLRATYSPDLSLVVLSKPLSVLATGAAKEAIRLDAAEAPQRERAQQAKEAVDGRAAHDKARAANKATFRP